ncbi:MAG: hypothetical protein ABI415_04915 [Flavitalea sp.]
MKKFLTSILAVLYIVTSSGATVHMHYCMGKLADLGLRESKSKNCPKCGMEKSDKGCCKDEHKFLKDDSAQKLAENNLQMLLLSSVAIPASFTELPATDIPSVPEENPVSHAPPRTHGIAIYIFKRSFLI